MNKSILISIKPRFVADILNGHKTIEIRKTMPKCDLPIEVYIYCTKEKGSHYNCRLLRKYCDKYMIDTIDYPTPKPYLNGKVVAKFTLNKVEKIEEALVGDIRKNACLSEKELLDYLFNKTGFAWHIDNLVVFDKPKELFNFEHEKVVEDYFRGTARKLVLLTKAPQSWCYVEVEEDE